MVYIMLFADSRFRLFTVKCLDQRHVDGFHSTRLVNFLVEDAIFQIFVVFMFFTPFGEVGCRADIDKVPDLDFVNVE